MIRVREISMTPQHHESQILTEVAKQLKVSVSKIKNMKIVRRSIDARKKPNVKIIYTVDVAVEGDEEKVLKKSNCKKAVIAPVLRYDVERKENKPKHRPVVVGFGPAGMFASLVLAMAGLNPIVYERGEDAKSRHEKVQHFFETGELDTKSNVQFGEGGAGTFSDGKLNTGVNNPRI